MEYELVTVQKQRIDLWPVVLNVLDNYNFLKEEYRK